MGARFYVPARDSPSCYHHAVMDRAPNRTAGSVSDQDWGRLERMLAERETWPSMYCFKFIVPEGQANRLVALLADLEPRTRRSRSGRFVSVTCEKVMRSSTEVVAVYRRAAAVEGLLAL